MGSTSEGYLPTPSENPWVAPDSYEELFERYWSYALALVIKQGVPFQDAPDVTSEILVRFMERDFLAEFDPDYHGKGLEGSGGQYNARFKSFFSSFVLHYVRGHRDRLKRREIREPLKCDELVGPQHGSGRTSQLWVEIHGPQQPDVADDFLDNMSARELVVQVREYLDTIPPRSSVDVMDLPGLWDQVVEQQLRFGFVDRKKIAAAFGVSTSAIGSWMNIMKEHIIRSRIMEPLIR